VEVGSVPAEEEYDLVAELSAFVLNCLTLAKPPEVPARYASVDSLQVLCTNLMSLREVLNAASNGDLSTQVCFKGYVAGALKTLQANLRHVTWQTKMVASGDFTQRIEFMGEFSQSFNAMVMQLDQTLNELMRNEAELAQANEELLKEIIVRKQAEAVLRENEEELRLLAISDSLTGLNNRRRFFELAEAEVGKALRYSRPLAVMMFDIDFFKHVNDTYGHTGGDVVLKMVAEATRETVRITDIPARYGGEEFVVLLPETHTAAAITVAERLRSRIEATPVPAQQGPIGITASFGVCACLDRTNTQVTEKVLSEFIDGADQALYVSKNAGRNRVTVHEPGREEPR
jgi:diguanylate cyclase (GGDEF)-like protein